MSRILPILLCLFCLQGCYYVQAVRGHIELMSGREPIVDLVEDPDIADEMRQMLRLAHEARRFSVERLALPDNESYKDFVQTDRRYVVWNVFATQEFSLEAETFCFPVAGCVGYQGYFAERDAAKRAARLAERGLDVAVGGVAAYSTLGRFADPVIDTMAQRGSITLVETMFHELAHQRVYVRDDTAFNESFATAVAVLATEEWLQSRRDSAGLAAYRQYRERNRSLEKLMEKQRFVLQDLYGSPIDTKTMRETKRRVFLQLEGELQQFFAGQVVPDWFAGQLNNATLLPFSLYGRWQPAFEQIFRRCDRDFKCLYQEVDVLAAMSLEQRHRVLDAVLGNAASDASASD